MRIYSRYGYKKNLLCLGYKSDEIINYFKNLSYYTSDVLFDYSKKKEKIQVNKEILDWQVQLAHTGLDSNTGFLEYTKLKNI